MKHKAEVVYASLVTCNVIAFHLKSYPEIIRAIGKRKKNTATQKPIFNDTLNADFGPPLAIRQYVLLIPRCHQRLQRMSVSKMVRLGSYRKL